MRLYQQLILFMLAATVLPLALLGFYLLRTSEGELARRIGNEQRALATSVVREARSQVLVAADSVGRSASAISDWSNSTPEEVRGALSLIYQQVPQVRAVVLVAAPATVLGGPVFVENGPVDARNFNAELLPELLSVFSLHELSEGQEGSVAISSPYGGSSRAVMAVAVKLEAGPESPFVLAELALSPLDELLVDRVSADSGRIELVDNRGRVLASSEPSRRLQSLDPEVWRVARTLFAEATVGSGSAASVRQLLSAAKSPEDIRIYSVVAVDEAVALRSVRSLRQTVLLSLGVALGVLLLLGLAFTRRLNGRLRMVVEGAEAFTRGELSRRIRMGGSDELSELSETFNKMGAELESSRGRLTRWNDELKAKVDEATAELRAAQVQLLEAQKLAAVGQLGAGVAHEINNPLAGILGHTQLLMLDRAEGDPDFEALRKIELSAKRCKEITQNLLRFSQQREKPELRPSDLNAVARDALSLTQKQLQGDGISVVVELSSAPLTVRADPGHISQVILALIANARTAMAKSEKRTLTLRTRLEGAVARLEVSDTGKGISPENLPRIFEPFFTTKDVWSNVGLGLSVAYRVMSEHQGRIEVETRVGEGTTFTLTLPRPGLPESHLASVAQIPS